MWYVYHFECTFGWHIANKLILKYLNASLNTVEILFRSVICEWKRVLCSKKRDREGWKRVYLCLNAYCNTELPLYISCSEVCVFYIEMNNISRVVAHITKFEFKCCLFCYIIWPNSLLQFTCAFILGFVIFSNSNLFVEHVKFTTT